MDKLKSIVIVDIINREHYLKINKGVDILTLRDREGWNFVEKSASFEKDL